MAKKQSRYAIKGTGYDYSHLFRDVPEKERANKPFQWTSELARNQHDDISKMIITDSFNGN